MKLNIEKKAILTALLCAVLVFAVAIGIIWPLISSIVITATATQEQKTALEERARQSLTVRSAIKKAAAIQADLAGEEYRLFAKGNELEFITSLERAATRAGVALQIAGSNLDTSNRRANMLQLEVEGTYEKILAYLQELESSPYFIVIERIILTGAEVAENGGRVHATIAISMYVAE